MHQAVRCFLTVLLLIPAGMLAAELQKPANAPVAAAVETTLKSAPGQIRQFAFDGDPSTCFVSAENVKSSDHFTLVLDRPVAVKSLVVTTGRPRESDQLDSGTLEGSADGKTFE